jgi:hypothetical protein
MLLVVATVYQQQLSMYENKEQRIDDRIVSLTQPHIRPIVRGKAGVPVELSPIVFSLLMNSIRPINDRSN